MEYHDFNTHTMASVPCCVCGVAVSPPNAANMCVNCLRSEVDISEGISKTLTISWCRGCGRYQEPPSKWITCTLESKELLMYCLRRLKGLGKVKLVDANFVWTEPHSKRVKVKLTIQKEVFTSTILQQTFIVEYVVSNLFCPDCHQHEAGGDDKGWQACAQVRQRVAHKRTFFWLEQLILHHDAHMNALSIKESPDGLDFYFNTPSHCKQFLDFLQQLVPIRYSQSKKLVSQDLKSNLVNYKFSYSVEIPPICKDDLVCLPSKLSQQLGGFSPLCLVYKISNQIHIIDPWTLQAREIANGTYWHLPFRAICSKAHLTEFIVLDIETSNIQFSKYTLADITVARLTDFGKNDHQYYIRTHLGHLKPGDTVAGYDLTTINLVDDDIAHIRHLDLPEIVLVKKTYPVRRNQRGNRHWKLKTLAKEAEMLKRNNELAREHKDYEEFLQELEEDPEMRGQISLYKIDENIPNVYRPQASSSTMVAGTENSMEQDGGVEPDFPEVQMEELLDELAEISIDTNTRNAPLSAQQLALQQQMYLNENGE